MDKKLVAIALIITILTATIIGYWWWNQEDNQEGYTLHEAWDTIQANYTTLKTTYNFTLYKVRCDGDCGNGYFNEFFFDFYDFSQPRNNSDSVMIYILKDVVYDWVTLGDYRQSWMTQLDDLSEYMDSDEAYDHAKTDADIKKFMAESEEYGGFQTGATIISLDSDHNWEFKFSYNPGNDSPDETIHTSFDARTGEEYNI